MIFRSGPFVSRSGALAALLLISAVPAWPQAAPPAPGAQDQGQSPAPPPPPAPQEAPENPGLINEMGKLIDRVMPSMKSPGQTLDDFNRSARETARDAGDAISRLARPGAMVSGRTACPPAADGTPDCKSGADRLCQSKGYKEGKSLSTDSAESCSARVLIPGRQRKPEDCRTDNYVTTALCL